MKKTFFALIIFASSCIYSNAQITNPAPYCNAAFDDMDGFVVDDAINSVSIGTLTNASNGQFAAPHYVFYNNLTAPNLTKGTSYTLSVDFAVRGGCGYGVWIDYNQNNIFEATEKVAGNTANNSLDITDHTVITQSITIPASATSGNTRMRVRIVEDDNYNMTNDYVIAPCNSSTSDADVMDWGETEDYIVNIVGGTSSPIANTTVATAVSSTIATVNGNVNANGTTCTVTFEYGTTIAYGSTKAATPGSITGTTATNTLAQLTGLIPNTLYHYRIKAVAGTTNYYGADLTFTTLSTEISENNRTNSIEVYPNPATDYLTIRNFTSENINIHITDILGQVVMTSSLSSNENRLSISGLNDGIYFIKLIKTGKSIEQYKFVKTAK